MRNFLALLFFSAPVAAAGDSSAAIYHVSADNYSSISINADTTLADRWLLGAGLAQERDTGLRDTFEATAVSLSLISLLDGPWQFGVDMGRWQGDESTATQSVRGQVDYLFDTVSVGLIGSSRDMTITALRGTGELLKRNLGSTGIGVDVRWFVSDSLDAGLQFVQYDYDFDPRTLNAAQRPILATLLSLHTFGIINSLADEDWTVDLFYSIKSWQFGVLYGSTSSAVDGADTRSVAVTGDLDVTDQFTLLLETARQSTDRGEWSSQFGIGARFRW